MNEATGRKLHLVGPGDPFVTELENKLQGLIGILSRYIIEKSYSEVTDNGHDKLNLDSAQSMCSSIIEEATILLGPKRTEELNSEFEQIIKNYFKEGKTQ
jgi:hypothetical protein